ncbi:Pre-mRNA-splicing factor cwc26 [Blastocladiella emersonii ATCC 22665]|nr:Pre-mRNA-splicing factor cwc26 [Blastocladiella emersonii ATCC 22665]
MASKEYLSKYLDSGKKKKKKKKASKQPAATGLIIDDDADLPAPSLAWEQHAPQVVVRKVDSVQHLPPSSSVPNEGPASPARSPARKRARHDSDSELDADSRPSRRRARHDSDSEEDAAPRRRRRHDSDSEDEGPAPAPRSPRERPDGGDGAAGRESATVYRDQFGRKVALDELKQTAMSKEEEKEMRKRENQAWALGTAQRRMAEERRAEELRPMTRTADDKELNDMLKERERWGDPGAMLAPKQDAKAKKKNKDRPTYSGSWAPNRFDIPPGFRWDGLDRSNGFERKLYIKRNERAAADQASYKWRSEDM